MNVESLFSALNWLGGIALLGVLAIWLTPEGGLAITEDCQRKVGFVTEIREALQGSTFWREQGHFLDRRISELKAQPAAAAEAKAAIAKFEADMEQVLQQLYKEILRPHLSRAADCEPTAENGGRNRSGRSGAYV